MQHQPSPLYAWLIWLRERIPHVIIDPWRLHEACGGVTVSILDGDLVHILGRARLSLLRGHGYVCSVRDDRDEIGYEPHDLYLWATQILDEAHRLGVPVEPSRPTTTRAAISSKIRRLGLDLSRRLLPRTVRVLASRPGHEDLLYVDYGGACLARLVAPFGDSDVWFADVGDVGAGVATSDLDGWVREVLQLAQRVNALRPEVGL